MTSANPVSNPQLHGLVPMFSRSAGVTVARGEGAADSASVPARGAALLAGFDLHALGVGDRGSRDDGGGKGGDEDLGELHDGWLVWVARALGDLNIVCGLVSRHLSQFWNCSADMTS